MFKKVFIKIFLAVLLLECTVFNINFYINMFNNEIAIESYNIAGNADKEDNNTYKLNQGDKYIEINNINKQIKNICFDINEKTDPKNKNNRVIEVKIFATDEGNNEYFPLPNKQIVYGVNESKYIKMNLNGESEKIKINIITDDKTVDINKLVINSKVPFNFNIIRVILLFMIISVLYIIRPKSELYSVPLNINSGRQFNIIYIICLIIVASVVVLGITHPNKELKPENHHYQYHKMVTALLNGHFYLEDEPCDTLLNMDNPYDYNLRNNLLKQSGEKIQWDHAYYNGKYYMYFGITPALLFFLPARLLGLFILNKTPVMILCALAVIFSWLLIYELAVRYFKKPSLLVYIMTSVIFSTCTGVFISIKVVDLYHIPIMNSLAFSIAGLYCIIHSMPNENREKFSSFFLFIGALFLALVAGCRPQVLLASFFIIPLFWNYIFKERKLFSKESIKQTMCFILPYAVYAVFIMYYNYARFGSIFDFGANYNLTVIDMTAEKFNFSKIPLGLYTYFLQPPYLKAVFPFINSVNVMTEFMGNYVRGEVFGGLFICYPILLFMAFIFKVKNILADKKIFIFTLLMPIFCIVISVLDFNIGGITLRYMNDFMWLMFLPSIIIIFALFERYYKTEFKAVLVPAFSISFVLSMVYCFMLFFNSGADSCKNSFPQLYYSVKYAIEFWL